MARTKQVSTILIGDLWGCSSMDWNTVPVKLYSMVFRITSCPWLINLKVFVFFLLKPAIQLTSILYYVYIIFVRPHVNPPGERLLVSNSQRRLPVSQPLPPEVSRSLTGTDREPLHYARSVATRRVPICWSVNFPSNVSFVKSPKTSNPICDSKVRPY